MEASRFDYKVALDFLKKLNEDKDKIDINLYHDVCKIFTKISASMGYLVSWGFDDINEKCRTLMVRAGTNTDCKSIHELVEKEMSQNIHILNGNNGEKFGYKPGHPLYKYESASRTILRLLYFLTLLTHLLKNLKQYPDELMSNVARKSYEDSIASFHPPVLRESIKAAFLTVPTRKEFMENAFGTTDKTVFNDILGALLKPLAMFVARVWKYYQEKKITNLE